MRKLRTLISATGVVVGVVALAISAMAVDNPMCDEGEYALLAITGLTAFVLGLIGLREER